MQFVAGLALCLLTSGLVVGSGSTEFYVAVGGNDGNNGSIGSPFATLQRARNAVRGLNGTLPAGGVTVFVRGGAYPYQSGALQLFAEDSGNEATPVVYSGYPGEAAVLSGGVPIKFGPTVNPPVPVPSQVLQCNLSDFGVTQFGAMANTNDKLELFYDGAAMTLARYPNEGFDTVHTVPDNTGLVFGYNGTRPSLWTNASDLWLHGYWMWDWRDVHVHVAKINTASQQFYIDPATPTGGIRQYERYYAENVLEELDTPNEYYLDRSTGVLYFYPPDDGTGEAWVSVAENVVVAQGASWITIQNLTIMHARAQGVDFNPSCTNMTIVNCVVANHGQYAISLDAAYSSAIGNEVYGTGHGGISVSPGNRALLIPGGSRVVGNNIHHYARWIRTYEPGVAFYGVANYIGYNNISFAPHSAILGGGNDMLIEYNRIDSVCFETSDAGGFYVGRSWAQRGNVLQYNTFSNVYDQLPTISGAVVHAIYLDDQMSGWHVLHNTVINCTHGIFIGGGRDTVVLNNTLHNVTQVAVPIDNRGMNWEAAMCAPGGQFEQELIAMNYKNPPWSVQYPYLVNIMNEHPCIPVNNLVQFNAYCGPGVFVDQTPATLQSWLDEFADNTQGSCAD